MKFMSATGQFIEGTWEEIARHAESLSGRRLRLEILDQEPPSSPDSCPTPGPRNLAELLGDYTGSVQGTGEALSEQTGERFTDYLARKQREGHL